MHFCRLVAVFAGSRRIAAIPGFAVTSGGLDVSLWSAGAFRVVFGTVAELLLEIVLIAADTAQRRVPALIAVREFDVAGRFLRTSRIVLESLAKSLLDLAFGGILAALRRIVARAGLAVSTGTLSPFCGTPGSFPP